MYVSGKKCPKQIKQLVRDARAGWGTICTDHLTAPCKLELDKLSFLWSCNVCRQRFGGLLRFAGRFLQLQRTDSFLHLEQFIFICLPALNPVHPMTKVQQENGTSQRRCRPYLTRVGRNDTWSGHGRHVPTFWPGLSRLLSMFVRNVWLVFKLRPSLEHVQLHNLHGTLYLYTTRYIYWYVCACISSHSWQVLQRGRLWVLGRLALWGEGQSWPVALPSRISPEKGLSKFLSKVLNHIKSMCPRECTFQ